MANNSHSGHLQNVANFEKLLTNVTVLGPGYNPSKSELKIDALFNQCSSAKTAIDAVRLAEINYKKVISIRETGFGSFGKLITRISNSLKASGVPAGTIDIAMALVRKLQGRRATAKKSDEEKQKAASEGKEIVEISSSKMSYDHRIANFDQLIKLLASIKEYNPNEEDLKVEALSLLLNKLISYNQGALNAEAHLNHVRIARNNLLYGANDGMVDVGFDVKIYVKSVYGTTSPQYKTISGIKFTSYN
jgi:hypothetical protein